MRQMKIAIISCVILLLFIYLGIDDSVFQVRECESRTPVPRERTSPALYKGGDYGDRESPSLAGRIYVNNDTSSAPTFEAIRIMNGLSPTGQGYHKPSFYKSMQKVAILIPFRKREPQLRVLLNHLFPILRRQLITFSVYVINQAGDGIFNRAKLFNVGIVQALKDRDFDCFIFHDVDLLLKDDRCFHHCDVDRPVHLSRYVDIFNYVPLKYDIECPPPGFPNIFRGFGGVSALTKQQALDVNGYSNFYWGWGGEDDDMNLRLLQKGYKVLQPFEDYCSYIMIRHEHESTNKLSRSRYKLLYDSVDRMEMDGLNNLMYEVISVERNPIYINITVDIGDDLDSSNYVAAYLENICEDLVTMNPETD